jgi:hypothetical protein
MLEIVAEVEVNVWAGGILVGSRKFGVGLRTHLGGVIIVDLVEAMETLALENQIEVEAYRVRPKHSTPRSNSERP